MLSTPFSKIKAYPSELRWLVIYLYYLHGKSVNEVAESQFVSKGFMSKIWLLYKDTEAYWSIIGPQIHEKVELL